MTIITTPPAVPDLLGTSPADLVPHAGAPASTPDEARERADRIRAGLPSYVQMRQEIAAAYVGRDWAALQYAAWPEYVMAEFGPDLLRLSRGERQEAVADLRTQGMSTRQIAGAVGVSHTQVRKDLSRPQVETKFPPEPRASRDVTPEVAQVDAPPSVAPKPAEPERVKGTDGKSYPSSKPKPPEPADPEVAAAREKAKQEARDRDAGRTWASRIVPDLQTAVVTIGIAVSLGETDLVTAEMIADCRRALDVLESILKGEK